MKTHSHMTSLAPFTLILVYIYIDKHAGIDYIAKSVKF